MRLGERMDRQYQRAVKELEQAHADGEYTDKEHAAAQEQLHTNYEKYVDDVAEMLRDEAKAWR